MAQARTNPWLVLLVLTTGFFMIMLDTTIVNVAIPAMSTGLNTTLDQILWVLNAYVMVYAVLLITAGRLGDLYGQRNLFAIGLFVFTVASALCGLSQNPAELIAYVDWRWIFYINVPIGIASLIATFLVIPDLRPGRRHGWDVVGIVVATAGLFAIVFGLEALPDHEQDHERDAEADDLGDRE